MDVSRDEIEDRHFSLLRFTRSQRDKLHIAFQLHGQRKTAPRASSVKDRVINSPTSISQNPCKSIFVVKKKSKVHLPDQGVRDHLQASTYCSISSFTP